MGAQVLTGLEEACRKQCDRQFDEQISLISSVSGGSVGTMYFVNEYKDGRIEPNSELHTIVDRAQGSSVDEISWGVLYPDLVRAIVSMTIPFGWDRGRALKEAWLRLGAFLELQSALRRSLDDDQLYDFMQRSYEVNREMNSETVLQALSRSTRVVGEMLQDISDDYQVSGKGIQHTIGRIAHKPAVWFARFGQVFWAMTQVAVPGSLADEKNVPRLLTVLYAFEVFLFSLGIVLGDPETQTIGPTAFIITAFFNTAFLVLRDYMRRGNLWHKVVLMLFVILLVILVGLALIGVDTLFEWREKLSRSA